MPSRRYAIIEAPSHLGLKFPGVDELPERLLDLGLAERLGARIAARLRPPIPGTSPGMTNFHKFNDLVESSN